MTKDKKAVLDRIRSRITPEQREYVKNIMAIFKFSYVKKSISECNKAIHQYENELNRVSMNFNHKALSNVKDIGDMIKETNKTRIVYTALEIAKTIIDQINNGKKIILKNRDGSEESLTFIGI